MWITHQKCIYRYWPIPIYHSYWGFSGILSQTICWTHPRNRIGRFHLGWRWMLIAWSKKTPKTMGKTIINYEYYDILWYHSDHTSDTSGFSLRIWSFWLKAAPFWVPRDLLGTSRNQFLDSQDGVSYFAAGFIDQPSLDEHKSWCRL